MLSSVPPAGRRFQDTDLLPGWGGETHRPEAVSKLGLAMPTESLHLFVMYCLLQGSKQNTQLTLSWKPRAYVHRNFLSEAECDHIVNVAKPLVQCSPFSYYLSHLNQYLHTR